VNAGAVYLFERDGYVKASNIQSYNYFGFALSGDQADNSATRSPTAAKPTTRPRVTAEGGQRSLALGLLGLLRHAERHRCRIATGILAMVRQDLER